MDFQANLYERLRDLLGPEFQNLDSKMSFSYSWAQGYEKLTVNYANGGGSNYSGAYHPNVVCEGTPCAFCGCLINS